MPNKQRRSRIHVDLKRLQALHEQGFSVEHIADQLSLPTGIVRQRLRRLGVVLPTPHELRELRIEKTLSLYHTGESIPAIAKIIGVSEQTIQGYLTRNGVPIEEIRYTPAEQEAIQETNHLYDSGVTIEDIATQLNLTTRTVRKYLGTKMPDTPELRREQMYHLHRDGYSPREIASKTGYSITTVMNILAKKPLSERVDNLLALGYAVEKIAERLQVQLGSVQRQLNMPRTKPEVEIQKAVIRAFTEGMPPTDIAEKFNLPLADIQNQVRTAGFPLPLKPAARPELPVKVSVFTGTQEINLTISLVEQGYDTQEIAQYLKMNERIIMRYLQLGGYRRSKYARCLSRVWFQQGMDVADIARKLSISVHSVIIYIKQTRR